MNVTHLSLLFLATVVLPLLLASSLELRVTHLSLLITNPVGFYSASEDSAVQSAVSGDDLSVDSAIAAGWSSDTQSASWSGDLSLNGRDTLDRDRSIFSVSPTRGELLLDFPSSCIVNATAANLSIVLGTARTGRAISGFWISLIGIFGILTNKQSERSSTSPPTFKKSRPRLTTDTVSFRIDSNLRDTLEEEAKKNRTSLNTLVSQILFRYADWWRYAGRLGLIPVSKDLLRDVFKSLDKPELEDLGRRFAETSGREHVLYLYQQISLGTILQFLDLWSSHFDAYEHRYDGKMHFYTVHHDVNLNFSIFVKEFVSTMILGTVPRTVRFETVAANSVTFSFEG